MDDVHHIILHANDLLSFGDLRSAHWRFLCLSPSTWWLSYLAAFAFPHFDGIISAFVDCRLRVQREMCSSDRKRALHSDKHSREREGTGEVIVALQKRFRWES